MEMDEKKKEGKEKKEKWYYTTGGKVFRGFLCMVTFGAFMLGLNFTYVAVSYFGESAFQINPKVITGSTTFDIDFGESAFQINPKDYHDTLFYSDNVAQAFSTLLENISVLESENSNNELRILDTSTREICNYDTKSLQADYAGSGLPNSLEEIRKYKLDTEYLQSQLYSYPWALQSLEEESSKGSYLYFSKDSFRELFKNYGRLNKNHRYSTNFPESAYFIFDAKDTESEVLNGDAENEMFYKDYSEENAVEDTTEYIEIKYTTDSATELVETTDSDTSGREVGYAVYDPVSDVYYSTADNYFEPYDSYLYDCKEVLQMLDEISNHDQDNLDNIVFPLLRSENKSLYNVLSAKWNAIDREKRAACSMEENKKDAFVYYITCKDFTYSNVGSVEEITSLPYSYCIQKGLKNQSIKAQRSVESLSGYGESGYFESRLEEYFKDTAIIVCFGMDYDRAAAYAGELSSDVRDSPYLYYRMYEKVTSYGILMLGFTIIAFILLMVQAVSLILTTGRREKKNKETGANAEIMLYAYDKLPVEPWLAVLLLVLGISAAVAFAGLETASQNIQCGSTKIMKHALFGAVWTMPFGFCFMVLTLSFARRVKAGNFRGHFCTGRVFHWCWNKLIGAYRNGMHFYYKKNGADRLWTLFSVYFCVLVFPTLLLFLFAIFGVLGTTLVRLKCIAEIILVGINIGAAVLIWRLCRDMKQITGCVDDITQGDLDRKCELHTKNSFLTELADGINHIGDGLKAAVETSLKDERMKTELITNVSHDLKTPLTSIINYVDLLKKEEIQSEDAKHYLEVLDAKSQRLKQLTEDLVEAAKANSGNIELECMPLAFDELMRQAIGEFEDKFAKRGLTVVAAYPKEPVVIMADGRRLFRILENVLQNAYKYALEGTRIYAELSNHMGTAVFTLKNISAAQLNISPEELMERFTRGDSSRTTEGSGLGLSIAKDLTRLMEGSFEIQMDGDLFKVIVKFPEYKSVSEDGITL